MCNHRLGDGRIVHWAQATKQCHHLQLWSFSFCVEYRALIWRKDDIFTFVLSSFNTNINPFNFRLKYNSSRLWDSYKHHTVCKRGSAETSPMNLEIASQSSLCLRRRRTKRSSFHPCRLAMSILTRRRLVPAAGTTVQTTTSFGVPSKSQYELWDKDMPLRQSMASIIGIATNSQRNFQEKREPQECDTGWAGWADGRCYLCPRANVLIATLSTNAMSSLEKGRLYWLRMLCIGTLVKEGCFGVEVFDVV